MQVLNSTIPSVPSGTSSIPVSDESKNNHSHAQYILLKSSSFSPSEISTFSQHGKTLVLSKAFLAHRFEEFYDYDYFLIDVSTPKFLAWCQSAYQKMGDNQVVIGVPNILEKYEYEDDSDHKNCWLSKCDYILDDIPQPTAFKHLLDEQITSDKLERDHLLITAAKVACGCLGVALKKL